MPQIKNWERVICRNAESLGMGGTVRKWRHSMTRDTVSIKLCDEPEEDKRYDILYNDEVVTARDSLSEAEESVFTTLRHNIQGL